MAPPDIFELFGPARYTPAGGRTFHLRATMASDVFERRIVIRKRPYLEGPAPCDDTGPENDTFEIAALFAERDPGIPGAEGQVVYPDYHAAFLREIRIEGTGTLYFPGRGEKRVRLKRRSSDQTPQERNCEIVRLSFIEDGEDARAGADVFTLPSAKSAGPVLVRQLGATAASIGLGGDLLADIENAMQLLEAAVNSPFTASGLVPARAARVLDLCRRARRLYTARVSRFGSGSVSPLLPASAAKPLRLLSQIEDVAAAQQAAMFGAGTVRPRRFTRPLSIFEIATLLAQPVDELIRLNAGLPLFGIPSGTEVLTRAA